MFCVLAYSSSKSLAPCSFLLQNLCGFVLTLHCGWEMLKPPHTFNSKRKTPAGTGPSALESCTAAAQAVAALMFQRDDFQLSFQYASTYPLQEQANAEVNCSLERELKMCGWKVSKDCWKSAESVLSVNEQLLPMRRAGLGVFYPLSLHLTTCSFAIANR